MMKLQLNSKVSDIIITLYLIAMLFFRFQIENQFQGKYIVSIFFGVMTLFLLYFLVQKKVLNPDFFGLLQKKKLTRQQRRNSKELIE